MTGEGRPQVTRKVKTERTVTMELKLEQIHSVFRSWLRKTYLEFRGFADQDFEFDFVDNSLDEQMTLHIKAFRSSRAPVQGGEYSEQGNDR